MLLLGAAVMFGRALLQGRLNSMGLGSGNRASPVLPIRQVRPFRAQPPPGHGHSRCPAFVKRHRRPRVGSLRCHPDALPSTTPAMRTSGVDGIKCARADDPPRQLLVRLFAIADPAQRDGLRDDWSFDLPLADTIMSKA
jgi:hypothetical protein